MPTMGFPRRICSCTEVVNSTCIASLYLFIPLDLIRVGGKCQLHFLRSPELGPGPKNITAMKKVQQYWRIPYLKQALFNRIPNISIPLANEVQLECL